MAAERAEKGAGAMIGAEAYIDATKDTWRGWKWNAIADAAVQWARISPAEKSRRLASKTVLYLVGPEDHDRRKALAKGFANHNLIAVDIEEDRVQEVRKAGGLAICGSLQQVVMNWPKDWPLDVVDGDFCSGLVNDIGELPFCFQLSLGMHGETVVSLNLMRGRDAHSNCHRENVAGFLQVYQQCFKELGHNVSGVDLVKHRGMTWLAHLTQCWSQVRDSQNGTEPLTVNGRKATVVSSAEVCDFVLNVWLPQLNSYRSKTSRQVFDSVIHRWGAAFNHAGVDMKVLHDHHDAISDKLSPACSHDEAVRGRIAALRAVRTVKMRGHNG